MLWHILRGHRPAWFPLLSASRFVEIVASVICQLSVSVLFWLISISSYVLGLQVFASEGQNMTYTVSVLLTGLHSKLWRRARLWLELFASTVDRFLSRVSYFSSETRSLTSKKLYAFLEKFSCFLQLSDRVYVSGARCIGLFLLCSFWYHKIYIALYAQVCWLCCVLYMPLFG